MPSQKLDLSVEMIGHDYILKQLLLDEMKSGAAIFSRKVSLKKSGLTQFKCCLEWSNSSFDKQFELKSDQIGDSLNLKMFKDYLKGPKGSKNKKLRSIFDILKELDSLGPKGSILKVLEIERERATEAAVNSGYSSYSFSDLHNKRSRVEVVIVNASKMQRNNQNYFLFYVSDISDVLTAGLMKMQKKFQITLTNGLSHERLTPLNGILLNTELVLNRCQAEQAKNNVSTQNSS